MVRIERDPDLWDVTRGAVPAYRGSLRHTVCCSCVSSRHGHFVPRAWVAAGPVDVLRTAQCWLESAAFQRLTATLGAPGLVSQDLHALVMWSANVLDTRHGTERRNARATTWTADQIQALLSAAGPLGLLKTAQPRRSSYDITVLLGGATTGNRLRTALARDFISQGVDLGMLVAVTAERALSDHEYATDPDSVGDRTEWSNVLRYLRNAFGPLRVGPAITGGTDSTAWQDRQFDTALGRNLRLLVAPSSSPHRRANTSDGITFLLQRIPSAKRRNILLITSAIYAPYQFFAGVPIISSDGARHVELVGTPTNTDGDAHLLTQRIAQEIHSALNAATRLLQSKLPYRGFQHQ